MINNKNILITGGTGSFGNELVKNLLENHKPNKIIIFSRDEYKQDVMRSKFTDLQSIFSVGAAPQESASS